jgi:hypothetical protein
MGFKFKNLFKWFKFKKKKKLLVNTDLLENYNFNAFENNFFLEPRSNTYNDMQNVQNDMLNDTNRIFARENQTNFTNFKRNPISKLESSETFSSESVVKKSNSSSSSQSTDDSSDDSQTNKSSTSYSSKETSSNITGYLRKPIVCDLTFDEIETKNEPKTNSGFEDDSRRRNYLSQISPTNNRNAQVGRLNESNKNKVKECLPKQIRNLNTSPNKHVGWGNEQKRVRTLGNGDMKSPKNSHQLIEPRRNYNGHKINLCEQINDLSEEINASFHQSSSAARKKKNRNY